MKADETSDQDVARRELVRAARSYERIHSARRHEFRECCRCRQAGDAESLERHRAQWGALGRDLAAASLVACLAWDRVRHVVDKEFIRVDGVVYHLLVDSNRPRSRFLRIGMEDVEDLTPEAGE